MSATMNQSEKNIKSAANTEAKVSRRLAAASENGVTSLEQALRARANAQAENFSILGRILAVN